MFRVNSSLDSSSGKILDELFHSRTRVKNHSSSLSELSLVRSAELRLIRVKIKVSLNKELICYGYGKGIIHSKMFRNIKTDLSVDTMPLNRTFHHHFHPFMRRNVYRGNTRSPPLKIENHCLNIYSEKDWKKN